MNAEKLVEKVVALYVANKTPQEIAKQVNISVPRVERIITRHKKRA